MSFSAPEYLLLLPALALAGWYWSVLRLHSPLRALIILLAVMALAGPEIRMQRDTLDLYVLLDRSDSTGDLIDKGLPEWQRLLEKSRPGRSDTLRFINYGAEVAELGADGSSFTGSRRLTRTGLALSTIAAMADEHRPSRVLLFTDGYSTEPLAESIAQLQGKGIPLDFRLVREDVAGDFRVASLHVPERVQSGEPFLVGATVRGSMDAEVPLVIRRNGRSLSETKVRLSGGVGRVEFTDRIAQTGSYEYQVEVTPEIDAHSGNNRGARWVEITGGPRLLLVTRYEDDPVAAALASLDFSVETIAEPSALHAGMLSGARAVLINNVPAHEMPVDFLKSLDFFVREQGGGLLMAGGDRSFGAGGYFQSPIDSLLPVSMELKSEHRKLAVAMAIVMDRSGSMSVGVPGGRTKMDLADAGAAEAIRLLGIMDQVCVFAVDSQPTTVVPLTMVGEKKDDLTARVMSVKSAGGGIFVYNALEAAWKELQKSKAGTRHVILFSDAQDSEEPGDYKRLIQEMSDNGCTISVIGLGTAADVDASLLEDIAMRGRGRMFFSNEPMDLPKIFAQETVTIARSAFLKEPVGALATGRWTEISPNPIQWPAKVDGYNLSYARPDATVSLVSKDEYAAPLVAHARRGLGRSMAISFPMGGEFSESVRAWKRYGDFLQTTARFLMGDEVPPGIALRHRLDGTRLTLDLLYDVDEWSERLSSRPPQVRLRDEAAGGVVDLPWRRIEPGRFTVSRDLDEGGVVRGAVRIGDHVLPFGPVNIGTAVEWAFEPERLAELRLASEQSGGRELLDISKAWLRPPLRGDISLHVPVGMVLLLVMLAEALLTRTDWKLPQWSPSARFRRERRIVPMKAAASVPVVTAEPVVGEEAAVQPQQAQQSAVRQSRFQRAKDRK